MDIPSIFMELFEMNLQLCADSKYPVRTTTKEDPGFLWMLECQQRNDGTYLSIGRDRTMDAMDGNQNEDVPFHTCISGPNFGHFFEHFFRIGTLRNIEIPRIAFPNDLRHDDFESVNIQCKVYKKVGNRPLAADSQRISTCIDRWMIPEFLFHKQTWSTSFIVMLRSEHATVQYEVVWNESGMIYFQTKQVVYKEVKFWGSFCFRREKCDFQLTFLPGELKKEVCRIRPPTEIDPFLCCLEYTVFMAINPN